MPVLKRLNLQDKLWIGFKSLLAGFLIILPFAYFHLSQIVEDHEASHFYVPLTVALLVGLLVGNVLYLQWKIKRDNWLLKAVVDFSLEFTYIRSLEGRYEYVSPAALSVTGYADYDFYNHPNFMDDLVYPEDRSKWHRHIHEVIETEEPKNFEFRIVTKSGKVRWLQHLCGPVYDESRQVVGIRSTNVDVTEQRRARSKLHKIGFYDPLTDLPNRRYVADYMAELILRDQDQPAPKEFAVLFVDLNGFKYVNDAHGHSTGDELLKQLSERFKSTCMRVQKGLVSRFGGDEFVIVKEGDVSPEAIQGCVQTLNHLMEEPFVVNGHSVNVGSSVGVAIYPRDGMSTEELVKNADAAMYQAKKQGLSLRFFSQEMAEHASNMVDLHSQLKNALNEGLIKPYYQPLVDMKTGRTIGFEVLARWVNNDGTLGPSPGQFIPVSEETGVIWPLSEAIVHEAGKQILKWQEQGVNLKYSINVSARQFADDDFCAQAIHQFKEMGISPDSVQIELTETVLLDNIERSIEKVQMLKAEGFSIALDDFGTGFASLHYLTLFSLDTIKVDRAFVVDILHNKKQYAIAKSIINLAHDLDLIVVAEGIESEEQFELLTGLGCDIGQGFLFSRPIPAEEITIDHVRGKTGYTPSGIVLH